MRETRCCRHARITQCPPSRHATRGSSGRRFCESRSWPVRDCCRCRRSARSTRRSSANWSATAIRSRKSCSKLFQASILAATCIVRAGSRVRFPVSCHRTGIGRTAVSRTRPSCPYLEERSALRDKGTWFSRTTWSARTTRIRSLITGVRRGTISGTSARWEFSSGTASEPPTSCRRFPMSIRQRSSLQAHQVEVRRPSF